jgi:monovalent cation:H+ antiporter-2, CPA2 family
MPNDELHITPALPPGASSGYVIIAGFGVPGRALADVCIRRKIPFVVIDLNQQTATRCEQFGMKFVVGDARDPSVLLRAGIESAVMLAALAPDEQAMLTTVAEGRRLNAKVHILARCHYTSTGLKAIQRGANETVVAEQVVAESTSRLADIWLGQMQGEG